MSTAEITTTPIGSGATETVLADGREIGNVTSDGPGTRAIATMRDARRFGTYRFGTREDAIAAVVSYAERGYWTGELCPPVPTAPLGFSGRGLPMCVYAC